MSSTYEYISVDQQIQKLKSQKLSFSDEQTAKSILQTYGYYNIINGYRDPYIVREYDTKTYSPNVSFEEIYALFRFDHSIRDAVLLSMIDLEEHLRAIVADIIAEDFGSDYNIYLDNNNYRDKRVSDPKFSRNNVLSYMRKIAQTTFVQPIKYYRETHGIIPPWILLKGLQMGTLVNYVRLFKGPQREKLIQRLYSSQFIAQKGIDFCKDLLSDSLFMCYDYRNLAAHGGRVYNYMPKSSLRAYTNVPNGLPKLIAVLRRFKYSKPYQTLNSAINNALNEYFHEYPHDIVRLEQATGFSIQIKERVWINPHTMKFHLDQRCSGSKNCVPCLYEDAISQNYSPCKRCCSDDL